MPRPMIMGGFRGRAYSLLPHQLWVCRKVNQDGPSDGWLQTTWGSARRSMRPGSHAVDRIRGGRRVLGTCPRDSWSRQWQFRLKDMFDIGSNATWRRQTPAWRFLGDSLDGRGILPNIEGRSSRRSPKASRCRHLDLSSSMNSSSRRDERAGETLAYSHLGARGAKQDQLPAFLHGTPHRGKDYGFFG